MSNILLQDLVKKMPPVPETRPTQDVDISDLLGQKKGSVVLSFHEPGAREIYGTPDLKKRIAFQFNTWPDLQVGSVAMMAACFVAHEDDDLAQVWLYFAHLCDRLDRDLPQLEARFTKAFPAVKHFNDAVDGEKNA